MLNKVFTHNDPDNYHGSKLTLHDCIADKISFENNVLSFNMSDGFWIDPTHESSELNDIVRTDGAQVDFEIVPDEHFPVYMDVFKKRRHRKTVVEYWDSERLIKAILLGMSSRKIAKEEGVYYSVVDKSIAAARKNFKKFYENL